MQEPKVSVIIPSYNRFNYLMNAIKSVIDQDYDNLEVIVINDASEEKEYYSETFPKEVKIIHLEQNQKKIHGFGPGSIRNFGTDIASGKYLAFLDDDDIWLKDKLKIQIDLLEKSKYKMSSTDGFFGNGVYNNKLKYKKYLQQNYKKDLKKIYKNTEYLKNRTFPEIWNFDFINVHNCFITSSVVVDRKLFDKAGKFKNLPRNADYDCWLSLLKFTNSIFVNKTLFYYDGDHGEGRNYFK